jgi:hypothetical protein
LLDPHEEWVDTLVTLGGVQLLSVVFPLAPTLYYGMVLDHLSHLTDLAIHTHAQVDWTSKRVGVFAHTPCAPAVVDTIRFSCQIDMTGILTSNAVEASFGSIFKKLLNLKKLKLTGGMWQHISEPFFSRVIII